MKMKIIFAMLIVLFILGIATPTLAANFSLPNPGLPDFTAGQLIEKISTFALGIAGGISILFIIYAGIRYVTSGGSQEHLKAAKEILNKALMGLVIIISAYIIVTIIVSEIFGVTVNN